MQTGLCRGYWLVAAAVGSLGCASNWGDAPLDTPGTEERVVVTLQARDARLTLTSTPSGVRYAVQDAEGALHASLTLEQLQTVAPQLYELARSATALGTFAGRGEAVRPPVLDASLFGLPSAPPAAGRPQLEEGEGAANSRAR